MRHLFHVASHIALSVTPGAPTLPPLTEVEMFRALGQVPVRVRMNRLVQRLTVAHRNAAGRD